MRRRPQVSPRARRAPNTEVAARRIEVPAGLAVSATRGSAWDRWLDALPHTAAAVLDEWALAPDGAAQHGRHSLIVPVRADDATRLILKLGYPAEDSVGEIPALKAWHGRGAAHLKRADPRRGALLLERLNPRDLDTIDPVDACRAAARLYRRLHVPAPPTVPELASIVTRWIDALEALGRDVPAPPRFVAQALSAGRALVEDETRRVLHGDLHGGNVFAAPAASSPARDPWLAIDPKGFAGDPCYEPAPLLWNRWDGLGSGAQVGHAIRERFTTIVDVAELDERRCRDWVVVRAMIGASWEVADAREAGAPMGPAAHERITRYVTVAKAMQDVGGGPWW